MNKERVSSRKIRKTNIDFKSFLKKGTKKLDESFGIIWITGKQGTGKTYFAVYYVNTYFKGKIPKIKTNIGSLKIPGFEIEYFTELDSILDDTEPNVIYIIDEMSKKYTKEAKQDRRLYSWLQQSRKRQRYVLMITQEYLQTPSWLRGVADYVYTTYKIKLTNLFKTIQGFPYLDEETLQWCIEPFRTFIYKRNKYIAEMYDTLEPVNTL